jgi:hypothetical protein
MKGLQTVTTLHMLETGGAVAVQPRTDGHHLVVDALRLNGIRSQHLTATVRFLVDAYDSIFL